MSFVGLLQVIEDSSFSTGLRESVYMWACVDGVHVLGLCIFLGMLLFWELRLFNVGLRSASVSETWDRLSPWITAGSRFSRATIRSAWRTHSAEG